MKKIVYTWNQNGQIAVVTPASPDLLDRVLATIDPALNPVVIDDTSLPADYSLRDAWTLNNGIVSIDSVRASAIQALNSSFAKVP